MIDYLKKVIREVEVFVEMVEGDVVEQNLALHFMQGQGRDEYLVEGGRALLLFAQ